MNECFTSGNYVKSDLKSNAICVHQNIFSWPSNMKCSWWPPCCWLPAASATPHWAALFQCKTRGQRGESAAKPRAALCQSALKRSERSLPGHWRPLTGNEQRLSMERPPHEGRRRKRRRQEDRSLCWGGRRNSEHMVLHHMTHWRREESRAAILWLKCNNA